jgi:hypothetical protein
LLGVLLQPRCKAINLTHEQFTMHQALKTSDFPAHQLLLAFELKEQADRGARRLTPPTPAAHGNGRHMWQGYLLEAVLATRQK